MHRTTQEQPAARLTQEQAALIPLPQHRFEAGVVVPRLVGADFCVAWDTNRYSVPPRFASHTASVRVLAGSGAVFEASAAGGKAPTAPSN